MPRLNTSDYVSRFCAHATTIAVIALLAGILVAFDAIAGLRCAPHLDGVPSRACAAPLQAEAPVSPAPVLPADGFSQAESDS